MDHPKRLYRAVEMEPAVARCDSNMFEYTDLPKSILASLLFFGTILAVAAGAQAGHGSGPITVDDDGGADHTTIQAAIDHAKDGDTIIVEEGTYAEALTVDKDLTLRGAQAGVDARERSLLADGGSTVRSPGDIAVTVKTGADVTFDGFRFDNSTRFFKNEGHSWDLTLDNNVFLNAKGRSHIRLTGQGNSFELHQNRFSLNGPSNAIWISPADGTTLDVEITDNLWVGNSAWQINANSLEGVIARNAFNGTGADQWGILLAGSQNDLVVRDNLFRGDLGGISLWHTFDGSLDIVDNGFLSNGIALRALEESETETGDPKADVSDVVARFNTLRGDKVQVQHQGDGDWDVRLNDWGVEDEQAVRARAVSVDDDKVLQVPFLLLDGSPEPGLPENARTGQRYLSIQAAVSDAAPGDRVVVPASADAAAPTPYKESVRVGTEDVTVCGAVRGAPICSSDHDRGRWQLSHAQWTDAPGNGYGEAVLLEDPDQSGRRGSTSLFPPAGTQVSDIQALSVDLWIEDGDCGAGSPRIGLNIDEDADGSGDGKAYVYNETLQQGGCAEGEWIQASFDDPDNTFWRWNGQKYDSIDELAAAAPPGHEIFAINLEWDNGALAVVDNQQVNGRVLGERQDIACGWTADEICRSATARERTVIDADNLAGGPVELAADGTAVADLILTDADGDTGVHVAADLTDATVADNTIRPGPVADTDVAANGVHVDRRTSDVTVADNTVRGWKNAIKVGRGSAPTVEANRIAANVLKGIQVRCGDTSPTIRDNLFESNPIAVNVCGDGVILRGNTIDTSNELALVTTPASSDVTVDARLNDWGVLGEDVIRKGRIHDQGDNNTILVKPYRDSAGNAHPPLPVVWCFRASADLQQKGTTLGLQEAVDADLSTGDGFWTFDGSFSCKDVDGDGRTHRTIVLGENPIEAYQGATVDIETLIQSPQNDAAGGARIQATPDQPALEFVAGSQGDGPNPEVLDITVETGSPGIVVRADGVALRRVLVRGEGPGIRVDGATGTTIRDSVLEMKDPVDDAGAIQLVDSRDTLVEANRIDGNAWPGSLGVDAEDAERPTIRGNAIVGSYSGIRLADSADGIVEDNAVVAPRNVATTDSLGISLHRGRGHQLTSNLVSGAGVGLLVGGADGITSELGEFPGTATSVRLRAVGGPLVDQPTGFGIHQARLYGEEVGLELGEDTAALSVDAECNDWAAYHAATIETERIDDRSTTQTNDVDFQPFIQPDGSGDGGCLVPPEADFAPGDATISPGGTVDFEDRSQSGSKPIVRWEWSFGDGTNATVLGTDGSTSHTYEDTGTFPVVLRIEDADGMTSTAVGTVLVVDRAPTIEPIPDPSISEGETLRLDVHASDPEGAPLDLTATNLPPGASFRQVNDTRGRFEWSPGIDQAGVYTDIRISASDGTSTVEETFAIEVEDVPIDATAALLEPLTIDRTPRQLNPGQTLRFQGKAADADVDISSVVFHPDGPDSPGLEAEHDPDDLRGDIWKTGEFAYPSTGVKTIVMTVTDTSGDTVNLTDEVEVTANRPPVARAVTPVVVDSIDPVVTLDGSATTDPDDRPLTFQWTTSTGATVPAFTWETWSVAPVGWRAPEAGHYNATLDVEDASGATDSVTVPVRVDDAIAIRDATAPHRPGPAEDVQVTGTVVDEAGRPVADAKLELSVRREASDQLQRAFGSTGPDGTFTIDVPPDLGTGSSGVFLPGDHHVELTASADDRLDLDDDPGGLETTSAALTFDVSVWP